MSWYVNGCSFTYGYELEESEKTAWPSLISKLLNVDVHNDAVNGGTNQRIIYKTIPAIHDYDMFVIAWTHYDRFTEHNPVDNFEINFNPALVMNPDLHNSDDLKKNYHKYKDYGQQYYANWYNELYAFKSWLQQIVLLQSFFQQHQKSYIMLNAIENNLNLWCADKQSWIQSVKPLLDFFDHLNDDQLMHEYQEIQKLLNMIDYTFYMDFNTGCITDFNEQYPVGLGGHILEDGHIAVANKLVKFYNTTCLK